MKLEWHGICGMQLARCIGNSAWGLQDQQGSAQCPSPLPLVSLACRDKTSHSHTSRRSRRVTHRISQHTAHRQLSRKIEDASVDGYELVVTTLNYTSQNTMYFYLCVCVCTIVIIDNTVVCTERAMHRIR